MRKVTLAKWILAILFYALVMYFGVKGIESYYDKYIVTEAKMNDLQVSSFTAFIALCTLSTYNFLSYTKRYFKGLTKRKKR